MNGWWLVVGAVLLGMLVAVVLHARERWRERRDKRDRDLLLSSLIERRRADD